MLLLPPTPGKPLSLACSADSARLYVGCGDGSVACWDRQDGGLDAVYRHPGHLPVVRVACGPDGWLAAAFSRQIALIPPDDEQAEVIDTVGLGGGLVAFGPGGDLVYTAHAAGEWRHHRPGVGPGRHVVACSGDALALAAQSDRPWVVLGHGVRKTGGATWWHFDGAPNAAGSFQVTTPVVAVAVSPAGDRLAIGTRSGLVSLLDPDGSGPTRVLGSFRVAQRDQRVAWEGGVFGLAFTPDGRELLTVSSDGDAQR